MPIAGGTWEPKNYTNKYLGVMPLRDAVAQSINTVAVQVSQKAGLGHVIDVARRLGITSQIDEVPAIALGATEVSLIELTGAYAHMAANGAIVYPYGIIEIDTALGEPIYQREASVSGVVLAPDVVGMMNEMLEGVIDHGTGGAARIGRPEAGKTGTTSDYRDAWFMGYTPDLVTGVWVGNDDNTPMKKVTGGTLPASIWHNYMIAALKDTPPHPIPTSGIAQPLPWQRNVTHADAQTNPFTADQVAQEPETETQPAAAPEQQPPQEQSMVPRREVKLGKSFWDKLLH